jgi:hypothetical protein
MFTKGQIVTIISIDNDGSYSDAEFKNIQDWAIGKTAVISFVDDDDDDRVYGVNFIDNDNRKDLPQYYFSENELRLATLEEKVNTLFLHAVHYSE